MQAGKWRTGSRHQGFSRTMKSILHLSAIVFGRVSLFQKTWNRTCACLRAPQPEGLSEEGAEPCQMGKDPGGCCWSLPRQLVSFYPHLNSCDQRTATVTIRR